MLTKGDLVKIRQDSFLYPTTNEPWFVKRLRDPEYGVVVMKESDTETRVFLEGLTWIVSNKNIQLIGDHGVYKTKQNK